MSQTAVLAPSDEEPPGSSDGYRQADDTGRPKERQTRVARGQSPVQGGRRSEPRNFQQRKVMSPPHPETQRRARGDRTEEPLPPLRETTQDWPIPPSPRHGAQQDWQCEQVDNRQSRDSLRPPRSPRGMNEEAQDWQGEQVDNQLSRDSLRPPRSPRAIPEEVRSPQPRDDGLETDAEKAFSLFRLFCSEGRNAREWRKNDLRLINTCVVPELFGKDCTLDWMHPSAALDQLEQLSSDAPPHLFADGAEPPLSLSQSPPKAQPKSPPQPRHREPPKQQPQQSPPHLSPSLQPAASPSQHDFENSPVGRHSPNHRVPARKKSQRQVVAQDCLEVSHPLPQAHRSSRQIKPSCPEPTKPSQRADRPTGIPNSVEQREQELADRQKKVALAQSGVMEWLAQLREEAQQSY